MDPNTLPPIPPAEVPSNGKRILIAEDEKFISELYEHIFTKAGFSVITADNGKIALDALDKEPFDLMLLDIMMPEMNGLEALRAWKLKNPKSSMIIIMLTNLGQDAVIKEAFNLGANGYLIKASLTPNQVLTEVNNAFEGKQVPSVPS